jgi:hypothetical protein
MGTNNPINNLIYSPCGAIGLSGAKFGDGFGFGLAANATADLYTAPAGKRAIIYPCYGANCSATPAGLTFQSKLKSGGNYYSISISSTNSMNQLLLAQSSPIILEPGESASVNIAAGSTTSNTYGNPILEFDSNIPLKTAKLLTVINGNNTLYTCPANTKAFILDVNCAVASNNGLAQLFYSNASGSAVTRQWFLVNSAGSPGTTNSTSAALSVANGNIDVAGTTSACLNAGDSIVINTSSATATQMAWVNIMECPA